MAEHTQQSLDEKFPAKVYFVGAGGIGMAALERFFLSKGCRVAGYDRTPTDLTAALEKEGAEIVYSDAPELIPEDIRNDRSTLVIYTPAVPSSHRGMCYLKENGYTIMKRAQVLGLLTRHYRSLCFSGTHGKTTTSSMAAHILHNSSCGCTAFLGGVLRNYNTNCILDQDADMCVVEADEYDRSFHHLTPEVAVVSATDPDHLDIYGTEEAYLESFAHFTELIKPGGALLVHTGLKLKPRPGKDVRVRTYSRDNGDYHAANIRRGNGTIIFDLVTPDRTIADIELGVPMEINIENAIAAIAAIDLAGKLEPEAARSAMKSFAGPKRRFEIWYKTPDRAIIDDYAHHPDELRASIKSVKALYPDKKLTVAFQPHLYSRTRDFADQFAEALSHADEVILLPIYPAREEPIAGVDSSIILDKVTTTEKKLIKSKKDLPKVIKSSNFEVLLTVGAGDINLELPEIVAGQTEIRP